MNRKDRRLAKKRGREAGVWRWVADSLVNQLEKSVRVEDKVEAKDKSAAFAHAFERLYPAQWRVTFVSPSGYVFRETIKVEGRS